jgi:hypothetical protein
MRRPVLGALLSFGVLLGTASIGSGGCAYDWAFPVEATEDGGGRSDAPLSSDVSIKDSPVADVGLDAEKPLPTQMCKASAECTKDRYCYFADHQCGTQKEGTCELISSACTTTEYLCACDAKMYKSTCEAMQAGHDLSETAACPALAGYFRCGYRYCLETKEFCVATTSGGISEYKCVMFAATCNPLDCTCFTVKNLMCTVGGCDDTKVGQVKVKCP